MRRACTSSPWLSSATSGYSSGCKISIARRYSARSNAVRPRSKASRAATGVAGTGTVGPMATNAPASAASVASGISVPARLELHRVFQTLPGADAHALGRERITINGGDLHLLARIVPGEEGDVDLLSRQGGGGGAAGRRIADKDARRAPGRISRHDQVRGSPLQPSRDDRI